MLKNILRKRDLKIFAIISLTTGIFIFSLSIVGHFLTPSKLIPSSFIGGTIGLTSGIYFCFRKKIISKENFIPVTICTLISFGIVSFIIVFNFNNPILIVGCFFFIGLAAIISNRYFQKFHNISRNKLFGILGLLLVLPAFYFIIAAILKFQFGFSFLFSFIDTLLSRTNGQANFNAITPFLFGGGLILSFLLNVYSQIEINKNGSFIFNYKISAIKIRPLNLSVLIITGIVGLTIASYLLLENM
jgi:hypothetical protein